MDSNYIASAINARLPAILELVKTRGLCPTTPSSAMQVRVIAGLSFIACAWLQGGNSSNMQLIDDLAQEMSDFKIDGLVRVGDLSPDAEIVDQLLREFPSTANASTSTTSSNGVALLWNVCGQSIVQQMVERSGGPFGHVGSYTAALSNFAFGKEESNRVFGDVSALVYSFCELLLKAPDVERDIAVATQSKRPTTGLKSSGCAIVALGFGVVLLTISVASVAYAIAVR